MKSAWVCVGIGCVAALVGCGGGDSGASPSPPADVPIARDAGGQRDVASSDVALDTGPQPTDAATLDDVAAPKDAAPDTPTADTGCAPGTAACGSTDGTCVSLVSDPNHCGDCANVCPSAPHGTPRCAMGLCGVACDTGFSACGDGASARCLDLANDPNHCGDCANVCPMVEHGTPACVARMCTATCDMGFGLSEGRCVALSPPRLLSPLSGARTTSRRPLLRWTLTTPLTSAVVDVCRDRACTMIVTTIVADGTRATPDAPLDPGRYFWRARGRWNSLPATAPSATWEFTVGARDAAVNTSWGALFDPNGDGCDDAMVGASDAGDANSVSVFEGARSGIATSPSVTLTGTSGAEFAHSLASAGDVNGDGFIDAIVGAPAGDTASVYLGSATGLVSTASVVLTGAPASRTGNGVAGVGDVNGDGYGDVVVGAPDANSARVCLGSALGIVATACVTIAAPMGARGFGYNVGPIGDVNGDGFADVGIGTFSAVAETASNTAYLYYGSATGIPSAPSVTLRGAAGSSFGKVVIGGDFTGDGYADVAVSSFTEEANAVYVFNGGATGVSATAMPMVLRSPHSNDDYGDAVADAGDLDGDGLSDLAVGAPTSDTVYVYNGRATGVLPLLATLTYTRPDPTPKAPGSSFGRSVAAAGALTCGASMNLLVGAPDAHRAMFYGFTDGALGPMPFRTLSGAGGFGFSVARHTAPRRPRRPRLASLAPSGTFRQ